MIFDGLLISAIGIGMVFLIFFILIILMNITSAIVAFLDKKFPVSSPLELTIMQNEKTDLTKR